MTAPAAPAAAFAAEAGATAATAASARTFYAALAALSANTARSAAELFLTLDPAALAATWSAGRFTERLFVATSVGQALATALADRYVNEAVAAQGVTTRAQHTLEPQAFAGIASDGRDLESLLETPLGLTARTAAQREDVTALQTGASALSTIVETQVSDAGRAAAHTAITARREVTGYVRMLTPPSCGRCAILAGRHYRWSAGFERHPRCFPAGTVVSGPKTLAVTRRWYEGELAVIRTASGEKLSVTGNHPVLTDRGWVAASQVVEGGNVVRRTSSDRAVGLLAPHEDQMPARIEDLWRPHDMGALRRVPVAAEDFHGDGVGGHVDVVLADGLLSSDQYVAFAEQLRKAALTVRAESTVALAGPGSHLEGVLALARAAQRRAGSGGLGLALDRSLPSGTQKSGFAGPADVATALAQTTPDHETVDTDALRQRVLALASFVGGGDGGHVEPMSIPRWDAPAVPFSVESRSAYAEVGEDLRLRLSSQVTLDRVVEVSRVQWKGHVYNLTSSEGWYCADNLIVSNCDCVHIPAVEDTDVDLRTDPEAYFRSLDHADQARYFGAGAAEAIRAGGDMGLVVNASRPAKRAGLADPGRRRGGRVMPGELLERANGDRTLARRLLEQHGYIR